MIKKNQAILFAVCAIVLLIYIFVKGVISQRDIFSKPDASQSTSKTATLQDGIDCFLRGEYAKANDIFTNISDVTAAGYIGIMQMYGLGNYQHNIFDAQKNLESAPNTTPFLVPKADLILIQDLYLSYCVQSESIRKAKDLYDIALSENPDDKAVILRLKALKGIVSASMDNWDNYSFTTDNGTEGVYSGQIRIGNNWTKSAHGWGCFAWDDMSSRMGKFSNLKLNGSGLGINRYDYTDRNEYYFSLYAGEFKNDELVEGVLIDGDGKQYFGTFKNGVIDNCTEVRDVLGNVQ